MVHIDDVILLSHKKERKPFAETWMDLEILILSEVTQKEKVKYHNYITYMWNLNYGKMNIFTKQKQTQIW